MIFRHKLACGVAAFALMQAPAFAQETTDASPAAPEAASAQSAGLEDIVVTARKREESLQKVPVAVTAFTGEALEQRGFTQVRDLEQVTPGLKFTTGNGGNSGGFNAFIRGVGEPDFIVTSDPAVALYIDGVYVARSFGADLDLIDIDRIEVLRGPQGSLFGKNTIGGAVSITTRKPDGDTSLIADARFGSFDSVRLRASAAFPLGDGLSASISGLYRKADGWQRTAGGKDYGDEDGISGRAQLRWQSDGGADVLLSVDGKRQRQNGQPHNTIATNPFAPFPLFYGMFIGPCCELTDDPDVSAGESPYQRDKADAYNIMLTASVPLGTGSVKSISAYRHVEAFFGRGINSANPAYYGDFHDERSRQVSQELQYTNNLFDDRVTLLAGLYYFRERSRDHTQLYVAPGLVLQPGFPATLEALTGIPAAAASVFDVNLDFDNRQTTTNYAAFGNATIRLTDQLSLDVGGRYTYEKKRFYQAASRIFSQVPLIPQAPSYTLRDSWKAFTPKATLSFQATPDVLAYATFSKGFRSGGFNGRPTQFAEIGSYDPEHMTSYEIGLKSQLLDRRLRLNLAAFTNRYRDQQVQVNTVASDGVTIIARTENAGRSHMRGVEGEATAVLNRHVTLDGSFAYLDSDYKRYISNGVDLSALRLKEAPRWTANAGVSFITSEVRGLIGSFRIDAAYKSRTELDVLNSPYLSVPGHIIGNINLGLEFADTGFSARFTAENFTGKRVLVSGFDVLPTFGIVEGYYNPPARYFATLTYRY